MITINELDKSFEGVPALTDLNLHVKKGSIYGLIGENGSGKTTLIKHLTGVLKPDNGTLTINEEPVYNNIKIKERMGYVSDDLYFFSNYNLKESAKFFKSLYPNWNQQRYLQMLSQFKLDAKRKLSKFSKGMQKQAAFILTMSTMPDYLILDEPIDGLDPIIRKLVWKYVVADVAERKMTVLISSHNLREMEGICDCIGILSKGKMKLERDLDELKSDIHKIQVVFRQPIEHPYQGLNVLYKESRGSVDLLIIQNRKDVVESIISEHNPVLFDLLPLSLEEIFIYELGGKDREIENILF